MTTFADRLKELRGTMNSKDFAARAGIGAGTLSQYENGSLPTMRLISRISERLKISVEWLLHGTGEQQKMSDSRIFLESENIQHIENIELQKNEMPNVGHFSYAEIRAEVPTNLWVPLGVHSDNDDDDTSMSPG